MKYIITLTQDSIIRPRSIDTIKNNEIKSHINGYIKKERIKININPIDTLVAW